MILEYKTSERRWERSFLMRRIGCVWRGKILNGLNFPPEWECRLIQLFMDDYHPPRIISKGKIETIYMYSGFGFWGWFVMWWIWLWSKEKK